MKNRGEVPFKIVILDHSMEEIEKEGKKTVLYQISVSHPVVNWKLKRRYNDFRTLHDNLLKNYQESEIPKIPGKTLFPVKQESQIEKRRKGLETFIQGLLCLDNILFNIYFTGFLKFEEFCQESLCARPMVLRNYETASSMVFTDINYEDGRALNYVLCSKGIERPAKNKHDSSNGNKPPPLLGMNSKSILNGFRFNSEDPVRLFEEKTINKIFDLKAHCLSYFPEAAILIAGFSEGIVSVYKEEKKPRSDEMLLTSVAKIKVSKDRVTKVVILKDKGLLFVVCRTNIVTIVDMVRWAVMDTFKVGTSPILCCHIDESNNLGFSTTEDGKLNIFNVGEAKPKVSQTIEVGSKNSRLNCMDCDFDSGKIICAAYESGTLYVVDIGFPFSPVYLYLTQDSTFKVASKAKGFIKPNCLKYNRGRKEVYVGLLEGTINVYTFTNNQESLVFSASFSMHADTIRSISVIPELKIFLSVGYDSCIKVWREPESWEKLKRLIPNSLIHGMNPHNLATIREEYESYGDSAVKKKLAGLDDYSAKEQNQYFQALLDKE